MIREEDLATALIAKMAGTELKKVDDNTLTQASTGPARKIDPKQFLPGIQQHQQNQQQRMIEELNRQAQMLHPLPQQPQPQEIQPPQQAAPPVAAAPVTANTLKEPADPNQMTFDFLDEATQKKSLKQLDLIVDYLYSINNKLDKLISKRD